MPKTTAKKTYGKNSKFYYSKGKKSGYTLKGRPGNKRYVASSLLINDMKKVAGVRLKSNDTAIGGDITNATNSNGTNYDIDATGEWKYIIFHASSGVATGSQAYNTRSNDEIYMRNVEARASIINQQYSTTTGWATSRGENKFRFIVFKDTQPNQTIVSTPTDVLHDQGGAQAYPPSTAAYNLSNERRFKILDDTTMTMKPQAAHESDTPDYYIANTSVLEYNKKIPINCKQLYTTDNTDGNIGGIVKNAIYIMVLWRKQVDAGQSDLEVNTNIKYDVQSRLNYN